MNNKEQVSLDEVEIIFKALASTQRLSIFSLVCKHENICAKEISKELQLSQPDISYHLSKLTQAGVLKKSKDGIKHCYDLNNELLESIGIKPQVLLNITRR
ncbi:winged helix-turn-helix transcriptional regulator [Candidatus Bipolaricaulota bacterium]|nr:winged helix-turn-helix transcriptional regulator [Candidatus Bipolaricaulota bacterium]